MNGVNKTKNIAVVDNSVSVLMLIKQMMSRLGYENVTCFSCPQEALKEINYDISRFDAVFTNLGMPDIDGMCVIRELGKMSYRGAVCIISDLENRVTELAAEIAKLQWIYLLGSIAKPITLEALGDILTKLHKIEDKIECQTSALSRDALMRCIINDQVLPYYQPKVNLISRRVESVEVLARIDDGVRPVIYPSCFIPTAIKYDLVDLITTAIAEKTASDMEKLSEIFSEDVEVSINLSAKQLDDLNVPQRLEGLFRNKKVQRSRITVEITEESSLSSPEQLESLNRFRMQGFGVSLDDFGTGFANFQHLRYLPFTEVKVDRSLVSKIHADHFSQAILRSLVDFSAETGCRVVAEGVELEEEFEYLATHYPSIYAQGYFICQPKHIGELKSWYQQWKMKNTVVAF